MSSADKQQELILFGSRTALLEGDKLGLELRFLVKKKGVNLHNQVRE
jgi:hypothetical protein